MRKCKFIRIEAPTGDNPEEGFVYNCNNVNNINVINENCEFIDCGKADNNNRPLVSILSASSSIQFKDCSFTFSDPSNSCRVLDLGTNDGVFEKCTFIGCSANTIFLSKGSNSNDPKGEFKFINNNVKSNQGRLINAEKLRTKPIINGNTFEQTTLNNDYLIYISHNQEEVKLENNTFSNIMTGGANESNCGSITNIIAPTLSSFTIGYDNCKFIDINNNKKRDIQPFYRGAIQRGYSNDDNNINVNISVCQFKGCNSVQQGGAVTIKDAKDVIIKGCTFESNSAEYGGAVYIHSTSLTNVILVEKCTFINNVATKAENDNNLYGGSAIFLYAYWATVKKCNFKNNEIKIFDNLDSSNSMLLSSDEYSFKFYKCSFEVDNNSKFSIFYYSGKRRATLKIEECNFDGKLKSGACFIDGQLTSNKSPKLILKNCMF